MGLLDVLERENERLRGVRGHQMHALHERPYLHAAFGDRLRHVSYFLSGAARQAYWEGGCELVPNHFSEMPRLLELSTRHPAVLAAASPADRAGYFSLGTNADYVAALIGLEVNERMPRTFGLNQVPASQLLGYCVTDRPLVEVPPAERDRAIAARIVERVPDGATLQVGIGGVPNAVLEGLAGHRDLGIHTELRADGIVDLVEAAWRPGCSSSCAVPAGGRVGILSNGRGPAISCADALVAAGLAPEPPVDLGPDAWAPDYAAAIERLAPGVDALVAVHVPVAGRADDAAEALHAAAPAGTTLLGAFLALGEAELAALARGGDVPLYRSPVEAARALGRARYAR